MIFVIQRGQVTKFVKLDAFDRKLIARARRDNLEPARVTADAVGLSESSVLRRMRRLRAEGVIVADVSIVDPARIEPRIVLHVLLEMSGQDLQAKQAFNAALAASPEVQGAWDVTGETDYLLTVAVASMADYEAFCLRVLTTEAGVRAFRSLIVIREVVGFDPARTDLKA